MEREILSQRAVSLQSADGPDGEDGPRVRTSGATSDASSSPHKLWAPTAASPFLAAHLKSLKDFPPRQGADTLSLHKAIEGAMAKMEAAKTTNN